MSTVYTDDTPIEIKRIWKTEEPTEALHGGNGNGWIEIEDKNISDLFPKMLLRQTVKNDGLKKK